MDRSIVVQSTIAAVALGLAIQLMPRVQAADMDRDDSVYLPSQACVTEVCESLVY